MSDLHARICLCTFPILDSQKAINLLEWSGGEGRGEERRGKGNTWCTAMPDYI